MASYAGVPVALAAGVLVATGNGSFRGVSIRETAGAAAVVQLWDNASAGSGTLLGTYGLTAKQSIDVDFNSPRYITHGIFVVITGTVEGSVII